MKSSKILSRAASIFFCALPPILFCVSGGSFMIPLIFAIVLHECGHLIALKLLHGKISGLKGAPFGLCIEYDATSLSLKGEMTVSAAGCAVNVVSAFISLVLYKCFGIDTADFIIVSASLALLNMMPILPLDGGRFLCASAEYFFGFGAVYTVYCISSYLLCVVIFLLASYSLLTLQTGVYPLLFSMYIFSCNAKTLENTVFCEKRSICEHLEEKQRFYKGNRAKQREK